MKNMRVSVFLAVLLSIVSVTATTDTVKEPQNGVLDASICEVVK